MVGGYSVKKILFFLASVIKLIGQLLSIVFTTAYTAILILFSLTLILPKYLKQDVIYNFINTFASKHITNELTTFAYSNEYMYTYLIILVLLIILIGLVLCRVRLPLIFTGIPTLIIGVSLLNINFFHGMITKALSSKQLLAFEEVRELMFNDTRNLGLYIIIVGTIFLGFGIYLSVKNQMKLDKAYVYIEKEKVIDKPKKQTIIIDSKKVDKINSNLYCSECGVEYDIDSIFCSNCGTEKSYKKAGLLNKVCYNIHRN